MLKLNQFLMVIGGLILAFVHNSWEISCFQCGEMTDGRNFLSIENIPECEQDILENQEKHLRECPPEDECCFSLREHFTVSFWGHAATAKVFVRGCCSSLNETFHHLPSSNPPPLVSSTVFRAEILSQTVMNGNIKSRVMFCNTDACNLQKIPWSSPIKRATKEAVDSSPGPSCTPSLPRKPIRPKLVNRRSGRERRLKDGNRSPRRDPFTITDRLLHNQTRAQGTNEEDKSNFCECNCNCPTLICSNSHVSKSGAHWIIIALLVLITLDSMISA